MGRIFRVFKINDHVIRTGHPKLPPCTGDERIEGPPYHFSIIVDKEHLDKLIQGGEIATFEEWGTSCIDCWTWFQHPIQVFKYVVFQKYEHLVDDYADAENSYVTVFFTADEMLQINGTFMEEVPHEPNSDWKLAPRGPSLSPENMKEMSWAPKLTWKLVDGFWKEVQGRQLSGRAGDVSLTTH